jgi:hypothetical protein
MAMGADDAAAQAKRTVPMDPDMRMTIDAPLNGGM